MDITIKTIKGMNAEDDGIVSTRKGGTLISRRNGQMLLFTRKGGTLI
jgi:hypothetical protein